jgi:hypothetical protein
MIGINGWLTKAREKEHDKTKKTQRRSAQKKKHCLGCKHKEIEDLQIMPKCKHVYCLDCIDGIEEVVVEDDEAVKSLVKYLAFLILTMFRCYRSSIVPNANRLSILTKSSHAKHLHLARKGRKVYPRAKEAETL